MKINLKLQRNKQINIFTVSPAALEALSNPRVTSKLVCECPENLKALADTQESQAIKKLASVLDMDHELHILALKQL